MILSQLMDAGELKNLTPEGLRELILNLDEQIQQGGEEKILVSLHANVIGVKGDRPAGETQLKEY